MERWRKRFGRVWKDRTLILMSLPAVAMLILFSYVPMSGLAVSYTHLTLPTICSV